MSPDKIRQIIELNNNRIFKVTFHRRTNKKDAKGKIIARKGDLRKMVCRIRVKSRVTGNTDPAERKARDQKNDVLTVFEMAGEDSGYKTIPLDSITELVVHTEL